MDDRTLYATILGVARPWEVTRVELDDATRAVHVWLAEYAGTTFTGPECQTVSPLHDRVEQLGMGGEQNTQRAPRHRGTQLMNFLLQELPANHSETEQFSPM